MFVRGTVHYTGELRPVVLSASTFTGSAAPVTATDVSCDGTHVQVVVRLGRVESHAAAVLAADNEVSRVWGAMLVTLADCFSSASHLTREAVHLEPEPRPGVLVVPAASMALTAGVPTITVTPSPDAVIRTKALAATPSWCPSANAAYERYASALNESDPALQFLALYQTAILALTGIAREPRQKDLDARLQAFDPSIPTLPVDERNPPETPFTRARNQLVHPLDRGVPADQARTYAANQLWTFRQVVAALVRR